MAGHEASSGGGGGEWPDTRGPLAAGPPQPQVSQHRMGQLCFRKQVLNDGIVTTVASEYEYSVEEQE